MKILGVSGFARSGKDTIANYLVREYDFTRLAFADPMRDLLYATNPIVDSDGERDWRVQDAVNMYGWDVAKVDYPEIRALLQRLGTEGGRKIFGENFWVDQTIKKAKEIGGKIVISDVRFENEVEAIRANGGIVIRVNREGISSVNNHVSDKGLSDDLVDFDAFNNGTIEQLEWDIRTILEWRF